MFPPYRRPDASVTADIWSNRVTRYTNPPDDRLDIQDPTGRWVDALENIQSFRNAVLTADEIEEAILFRYDFLPANISKLIYIHSAESGFAGMWDIDHQPPKYGNNPNNKLEDQKQELDEWITSNIDVLQESFHKHPYHIMPINTGGNHWEVIFIVMEKSKRDVDVGNPAIYTQLAGFSIVDPRVSGGKADPLVDIEAQTHARNVFINERLGGIFRRCQLHTKSDDGNDKVERMIWVPKQEVNDNWSSGLRIIDFVWEMLRRIQDVESSGIRNTESLFRPMRPYFDPDYVRLDAAGAIAARGLQDRDFRARVCLTQVNRVLLETEDMGIETSPIPAQDLRSSLARPPVQMIPQEFLGRTRNNLRDKLDHQSTTDHDPVFYEATVKLLEGLTKRYKARLENGKSMEKQGSSE
ncbi:hypothetical protein ANO14919_084260 [Xylariales sp. No.14919]|nr:hypothetical protein ANO14919_084260 [Xylariales sp. No.14919]